MLNLEAELREKIAAEIRAKNDRTRPPDNYLMGLNNGLAAAARITEGKTND